MKSITAEVPAVLPSGLRSRAVRLRPVGRAALYALLIVGAGLMLVPFFWMLSSSLKDQTEIFQFPPQWIPDPPLWSNYVDALTTLPFQIYFLNTLKIEIGVITGIVISSALPAYSFARLRWPGRDLVFYTLLGVLMLPSFVLLVPTFILWSQLNGVNTFWPLILPAWFGNAFFIFLLRQFFLTIPMELEDAAVIDGAGFLLCFAQIILPLAKPALAVVVIFTFMGVWNDFLGPLIYLNNPDFFTIALGLATFLGSYNSRWDLLMSASTATILPMILVFFFFQRFFIEGVALTGLKG
jgi:multiple sugar transport system permease protein